MLDDNSHCFGDNKVLSIKNEDGVSVICTAVGQNMTKLQIRVRYLAEEHIVCNRC